MKVIIFLLGWFSPFVLAAQTTSSDTLDVYFFLLEDCKITQAYTQTMNTMYAQYNSETVRFVALFPNSLSNEETIAEFNAKYHLNLPLQVDASADIAESFGVTVTPEVILYNRNKDEVLYKGRIDNMFERIGKKRRVITEHNLEDAIKAAMNGQSVSNKETTAIGCFLSYY